MTSFHFKKALLTVAAFCAIGAFSLPASANVIPDGKTTTYAGYVNPDGSVAAGTGFKVVHKGTGSYTVTYPSSKFTGGFPAMTVSGWGLNGAIPVADVFYTNCGSGSCVFGIAIYSTAGAALDNGFVFNVLQAK